MYIKCYCPTCDSYFIGNSKRHHQMDYCNCSGSFIDVEEYGCRFGGDVITTLKGPKKPKKIDYDFFHELLICYEEQGFKITTWMDMSLGFPIQMYDLEFVKALEDEMIKELLE